MGQVLEHDCVGEQLMYLFTMAVHLKYFLLSFSFEISEFICVLENGRYYSSRDMKEYM